MGRNETADWTREPQVHWAEDTLRLRVASLQECRVRTGVRASAECVGVEEDGGRRWRGGGSSREEIVALRPTVDASQPTNDNQRGQVFPRMMAQQEGLALELALRACDVGRIAELGWGT